MPRRKPNLIPKPKKRSKTIYYLRKSKAKKPYLNKENHVRKFKPKKTYANTITCFACNELEHLSSTYPNKKNLYTHEATLVGCMTLNLIKVQLDISDASSIYFIVSVEDMEEIPSFSDHTLINSVTANPYGIADKYGNF